MKPADLGIGFLLSFAVSQAVRDVYLRWLFGSLSLFEVAFMAFGAATLVFGGCLLAFERSQIRLLIAQWRNVIAVNLTTMAAWLGYFGSLRLVEPAAVNLAFSGVAPVAVTLLGLAGLRSAARDAPSALERGLYWALLGSVIALAAVYATGHSGLHGITPQMGILGVTLAAFAGVVITAETIFSKRMNERGVSALAIVGVRFFLVTGIAGFMALTREGSFAGMTPPAALAQCGIFLVILIGPIYLGQAGLRLTTPLVSGVIFALGPVATLALQSTAGGVALAPAMLGITFSYAALAIAAAALAARAASRPNAAGVSTHRFGKSR